MENFYKVVAQSTVLNITKADGTLLPKCTLVLQQIGGQYEDSYAVTMLGEQAKERLEPGQFIAAALRFQTHEYNGQYYQDISIKEFVRIG